MDAFLRLDPDRPALAPGQKIIAPADYALRVAAQELLAEAEARAQRIGEEAERAFAAEKARGYTEGMATAQAEIAEQMLEIVARSVEYLANAEGEVARTVMLCLRKILGETPEEEVVIRAARNALAVVRNEARVTLAVRPEVQDAVRERIGEVLHGNGGIGFLEVTGDAGLEPGGCRLETEVGVVDASIEVQIQAIEAAMRARLKGK
jgi:type III secretion protein L